MAMTALVRNLLFALLVVVAIAAAGDQEGRSSPERSTPARGEGATPAPAAKPTPTPAASPTPDPEKLLEEFVPSEKLPADRAVAFPVDI